VNPNEFGIEKNQSDEIIGNLPQIKEERSILEAQFNDVIKLDLNDPETSKVARELRLKIRDNRTKGIVIWHKTNKEFFLRGGQFVDAIKNVEIAVNERMESDLQQIENHFQILEQKRIDELRAKRIEEIKSFEEFVPLSVDFGTISEDEFTKILNGARLQKEEEEKKQKEIEKARIEAERIEREQREADRIEREKIQNELENERKQKQELENELKKKREEEEERISIEKEREQARIKMEQERIEELKNLPIRNQLNEWVSSFSIEIPEGLEQNATANDVLSKFWSFKSWAKGQIEKI
jgi:hypothetical protein